MAALLKKELISLLNEINLNLIQLKFIFTYDADIFVQREQDFE